MIQSLLLQLDKVRYSKSELFMSSVWKCEFWHEAFWWVSGEGNMIILFFGFCFDNMFFFFILTKTFVPVRPPPKWSTSTFERDEGHGEQIEKPSYFICISSKTCKEMWLFSKMDSRLQRFLFPTRRTQRKAGRDIVTKTANKEVNLQIQKWKSINFLGVRKNRVELVGTDPSLKRRRTNGRSPLLLNSEYT